MHSAVVQPVRVNATLDASLSRWAWPFKWLLAIPHYVVLAFLWTGFALSSAVAFFAILFTGRYPRPIFDFNVGVLRWTWRVQYYTYAALGTDRYPPFTLDDVPDYPAHLEISYPERLSRGLVLVKSWLLAIPHYVVVGLFCGGGWWLFQESGEGLFGGGLIAALVLVAAVVLTFTGRYPRPIYDFVLGMDRWVLRVAAYAALMTDTYPPFRLDTGGPEPDGRLVVGGAGDGGGDGTGHAGGDGADTDPSRAVEPSGGSRWTQGRIASVVAGVLLWPVSLGALGLGGVVLWADQARRDGGYVTAGENVLTSGAPVVVSRSVDLNDNVFEGLDGLLGSVRLRVTPTSAAPPVFVGIAPSDLAADYLAGVRRSEVTGVDDGRVEYVDRDGGELTAAPARADIWTASVSGTGAQSLVWLPRDGAWTVVVANADGSAGIDARVDVGASMPDITWVAVGFLGGGVLLSVVGTVLIVVPVRRAGRAGPGSRRVRDGSVVASP